MKINLLSLCFLFLVTCGLHPPLSLADDDIDSWQVVEVGRTGDLSVRLRVKPKASLADVHWLAIEFDNQGKDDIDVESASYRFRSFRHELNTGREISIGNLASGNDHDLFPDAWKTAPVSPRIVKPGIYRVIDHPSLYSSALLGLPAKEGLLIKAEVFVDMRIKNELVRFGGIKFQFQWLYPDEDGFDRMRARLKHLLANHRNKVQHAYILHALLKVPEVADVVTLQELLDGVQPRTESFSGRNYVLRHINDHYADDPAMVDYFLQRLEAEDKRVADDLRSVHDLWDAKLLPPLLKILDSQPGSVRDVFEILRQRGSPQQDDPQLAQRLSDSIRHRIEKIGQPVPPYVLADSLQLIGQTHDRNMIPRLMPFLDDKTSTMDGNLAANFHFRAPPTRVCDNALEAILRILDGGPDNAYRAAGWKMDTKSLRVAQADVDELTKIRDKMIVTLKQRLTELNIQQKQ